MRLGLLPAKLQWPQRWGGQGGRGLGTYPPPPTLGGWSLRPWPPTPDWGLWLSERGAPFLGPALEGGLSLGGGVGPGGRSGVTGRETVQIPPHDFWGLCFSGSQHGLGGGLLRNGPPRPDRKAHSGPAQGRRPMCPGRGPLVPVSGGLFGSQEMGIHPSPLPPWATRLELTDCLSPLNKTLRNPC